MNIKRFLNKLRSVFKLNNRKNYYIIDYGYAELWFSKDDEISK